MPATQVDHIRMPYGNERLMRDPANLMSLCATHHSLKTRAQETGKTYRIGTMLNGWPLMSDEI